MNILNLYSGIGGNRKLWGDEHSITAIEINEDIAKVYKDFFPNDKVFICDAHTFLEDHYKEFDFIWSSPPCQSHSRARYTFQVKGRNANALFPDLKLYEEIIFLKNYFNGKWVVENVIPFYTPLIKPNNLLQRHYVWSNFYIFNKVFLSDDLIYSQISDLSKKFGFDLSKYKLKNKRQILRNCVTPELGKYILECVK